MTFATVDAAKIAQADNASKVWDTLAKLNYDYNHPDVLALNAQYEATVAALREMLGPDAHCGEVDSGLYCLYSDLYKDRCNFRPRGHITYQQVRDYVDSCKDSDIHEDDAMWADIDSRFED
jgi:hypothetical protein